MFIFMLNKNIAFLKNPGGNLKKRQDAKMSLLLGLIKTAQWTLCDLLGMMVIKLIL